MVYSFSGGVINTYYSQGPQLPGEKRSVNFSFLVTLKIRCNELSHDQSPRPHRKPTEQSSHGFLQGLSAQTALSGAEPTLPPDLFASFAGHQTPQFRLSGAGNQGKQCPHTDL